jgi:hypothetical protein
LTAPPHVIDHVHPAALHADADVAAMHAGVAIPMQLP